MNKSPSREVNIHSVKFLACYGTRRFITVFTTAATAPYPEPDASSSPLTN